MWGDLAFMLAGMASWKMNASESVFSAGIDEMVCYRHDLPSCSLLRNETPL